MDSIPFYGVGLRKMTAHIIAFLVMLNPFALFLYLTPVWKSLDTKTFYKVLFKASFISIGIFAVFMVTGTFLFEKVFQINFESFRIFGGIIIFSFAYYFIVKGHRAFIQLKENLDDLASEIALPFMIGAGTVTRTILIGNELPTLVGLLTLVIILGINFALIALLKFIRNLLRLKRLQVAFDKNMEVLLRLTGFFVGAIGVDMIVKGIRNLFFSNPLL